MYAWDLENRIGFTKAVMTIIVKTIINEKHHCKSSTIREQLCAVVDVVVQKWEPRQCAALAGRVGLINVTRPAEKQLKFSHPIQQVKHEAAAL